ncbi:hypothetical protein CPC08DRAFT_680172 [Agrocybe pediades]|nr:hypothetical protein CPC08DRAFT_680172 [Agrocybe pediades]
MSLVSSSLHPDTMSSDLFDSTSPLPCTPSTSTATPTDPPRQKSCSICPATFTRKTHLDRHIRSHMNERTYRCETCEFQFTRSDLLTRHKKTCGEKRSRRKSCQACVKAKVKCNLEHPCQKCTARDIPCEFTNDPSTSRAKLGVVRTRRRAGTTSSFASTSTRDATPESSSSINTPSDSAPSPRDDFNATADLFSQSLLPPTDAALAAFAHLGVNSPVQTKNDPQHHLIASENMAFNELATDFMQNLDTFNFDLFNVSPHGTMSTGLNSSDGGFSNNPSYFNNGSNNDFLGFDFSSNVSATPASTISSEPASDFSQAPLWTEASPTQTSVATEDELRVYTYLFFSACSPHLPIIHSATWQEEGKPRILIRVMQAYGALFVRTKPATQFVAHVLATARDEIIKEYTARTHDPDGQLYLILAFALIQTMGFSHQNPHERAVANVYHGMLKMMMTQSRLQETVQSWTPPEFYDDTPLENAWRSWAHCEMAKRLCCLERLHDCAQVIFFNMTSSTDFIFEGYLPCEDAIWNARSAQDWVNCLRTASYYGSPSSRLRGANAQSTLTALVECKPPTLTANLPPFAQYLLINVLIACIYSHMNACTWTPTSSQATTAAVSPSDTNNTTNSNVLGDSATHAAQHAQAAYVLQNALQNWLLIWQEEANHRGPVASASSLLPYFRLAQVSLLMLCDSEGGVSCRNGPLSTPKDGRTEVRILAFMEWMRQVRNGFLERADPSSTDLRDDFMKLCIICAQVSNGDIRVGTTTADPIDGILAFFLVPSH